MTLGFMLSLAGFITIANSYFIRIFFPIPVLWMMSIVYIRIWLLVRMWEWYLQLWLPIIIRDSQVFFIIPKKTNQLINEQAEVAILILSPLICLFMIFIQWVIIILYSGNFADCRNGSFAIFGIYFQGFKLGHSVFNSRERWYMLFLERTGSKYLCICFNCPGLLP